MIFVAVLGFLILLLLASWFVFALLGAVEKIVRGEIGRASCRERV